MEAGERPVRDAFTSKFEQAAWLLAEILHRRDHWAAQRHPFHERWFAGELGAAVAAGYRRDRTRSRSVIDWLDADAAPPSLGSPQRSSIVRSRE